MERLERNGSRKSNRTGRLEKEGRSNDAVRTAVP